MKATQIWRAAFGLLMCASTAVIAADAPINVSATSPRNYLLSPNDLVLVKVYRQDDLESRVRISADGTATFPLVGAIQLGGKTVEEATAFVRGKLEADYLVNPQVTMTILEYAKRRFTVLGQVQKPGTYEIPSEESVSFLQAVAMAGGFTRLANTSKVVLTRQNGERKASFVLDAKEMTKNGEFVIRPDDTISVPQRIL